MNNMSSPELRSSSTNGEMEFTLCTFCNNSTNGFEKRLFATDQPKGPFFPVLAELQGTKTKLDLLGRAVVCVACFHHLLRQWSSFERRGIPVRKREYNIITDDRVNNYQAKREVEIRRETEHKIKEIQDREERIRQEAEQRFEKYRQRQAEIRREAEKRLLEEQTLAEKLKQETTTKLKEEQQREEELRRKAEERIQEEKEKREYIRQEAQRLLREEKLLDAVRTKQRSQPLSSEVTKQEDQLLSPEVVTTYRTEVIIPSVQSVKESSPLIEETIDQIESDDMDKGAVAEKEVTARSKSRKMMVFDPETGCYRKKSDIEDDDENIVSAMKTERVEYRFHLRSDDTRGKATEAEDSFSKPDKTSEDIQVSMGSEQSIAINGKSRSRSDDGDEDDLKNAGDIMKAKFEEGRKKFEQEPYERKRSDSTKQRTARQTSDDSLEEKIREMERRRERLLLKGPSMELEKRRRSSDDTKDLSPKDEPKSPGDRAKSPDDNTKRQRSRSERNKRRLTAEELSLKKSLSEEDAPEVSWRSSDTAKVPKTETKKETFTIQLKRTEKPDDEVFMTQVKPVEAGSGDLMSWDDDFTDGRRTVPEEVPPPVFRKRADSMEGETFPRPLKLVEIETPIAVTQKGNVESAPVATRNILDLDESSNMSAPVIDSISNWDNNARAANSADEERRRREKEHQERKRRIEENQRRGAKELKAKRQSGSDFNENQRNEEPAREMTMTEKRRSLVDLWESFSEPQTNVISFGETEEIPPQRSKKVLVRENRAISFDPTEDNGNADEMELDDEEQFSSSRPVPAIRNKKLSEDEQKWESAGNFQPGRLQKTVFHSLSETAPAVEEPKAKPRKATSRYDWMKGESFADQEALVPTKLKVDMQNQAADEKQSNNQADESAPKPVPRQMETVTKPTSHDSQSSSDDSESESEEERKQRIDTDDYHKLTEDEKQWESAGHFQPKKLNNTLMASFLQADSGDIKPMPKKTQERPRDMPKTSTEQKVSAPSKVQKNKIEIEEISPVHEVKTETEPNTPGTYVYEDSSSDDDDIPGWRKVEEQRRKQEREELERAKLEEKQRLEREAMDENVREDTDSSDDEFEAKVRTQEIRRIDPNLFSQFSKEPDKEPEKPVKSTKPKEQTIAVSNVQLIESTPSFEISTEEESREQNQESSDDDDDIPGWRKVEEKRRKQEQEELERARLEEQRRMEREAMEEDVQEDTDSSDDDFEAKVRTKEIRRINPNLFSQFSKEPDKEPEKPVKSTKPKEQTIAVSNVQLIESTPSFEISTEEKSRKQNQESSDDDDDIPGWRKVEEKRRKQEQEELERAKLEEKQRMEREAMEEDVQEDTDSSDDEFEAKVRTKEIRRINPNLFSQFSKEPDKEPERPVKSTKPKEQTIAVSNVQLIESTPSFEITTKEMSREQNQESSDDDDDIPGWQKVEEKRRKQEQEEIERAKLEEQRRMEREAMEEDVQEDADSSDDDFEAKVRTKEIRRINPNLFSHFSKELDKEPEKPVKSTKPKEQTIAVSNVQLIESTPSFEISTEEESREQNQESSDDDDDIPGWRKVEEKRRKQEQEELERAKLEEKQRMEREVMEEDVQEDTDSSNDEFEAKVRTKEIRRINPNLFSQFSKEPDKEPERPVKSTKPKEQTIAVSNVQLIESPPSFEITTEEKSRKQNQESSDDDDDIPGWRKVEEKRRKQEQEEIERAKLEEQRRMEREAMDEDVQEDTDSSDDEFEAKVRTQEIRRINPNLLCQFTKEPDKEPEKQVKSTKPKEQTIEVANVQLIESTPSFDSFTEEESLERSVEDEYEEKVKSGQVRKLKLDNNPFLQTKEDDHVHRDVPRGSRIVIEEERYVQNVERAIVECVPSRDEGKGYTNEPKINTYRTSTQESSDDESEEDDGVPEWRKMEDKRRRQEQEEIERAKLEEQRRRDREASESEEDGDADSVDDEFDAKVRTKEIRKINPNLLIQFIGESGDKETPPSTRRPQKEAIEIQRVQSTETSSSEDSDVEDIKDKGGDDDDEYELKVKSGQVKKLVLGNSPFAQTTIKEELKVVQRRPEPKQDSRTAVVQEEVLVQMIDARVVESEPDLVFHEPKEDDEYEEKVKSRFVKRLSQDQFVFLRKQEEEQRKKAQVEERRRVEREERERLKKEEERRRRLEAEVRAKEEERVRREEEARRREEDERIRKEEERRRKLEEAEMIRQEEDERIRREEEEEQMRLEQMRRQKHEAKKKFESGVFDGIAITHTEKDIYSVGRLDSNKLLQFQQSSQEEPKLKTKTRDKEKKVVEEYKVPEPEAETVVMASVDLNESSPYDDAFETLQSEDLEYEDKRKSVGKLDKDWYIKQQWKQVEEHDRRARELEDQRLREERNEMLRVKEGASSKQWEDEPSADTRDSEKIRSKLSVDKFNLFEQESRQEPKKSRKKKQKEETIKVEKGDEVQAAPVFFEESHQKEKRKSTSSEDGSVAILVRDEGDMAQRKMRLQREREETELLRREEEKRRLAYEEESYRDERESDTPKNVGKLNQEQFTLFQQERQVEFKAKTRKQAPQKVEEVISVQRQEDVESAPVSMYEAEVGPAVTQEDAEYEQRINTGKRLDVDRFLNSRAQEADEKRQHEKKVAEERTRQEQEELARLRAEEKKRLKRMQEELDEGYVEESTTHTTDFERSRKISIERRASTPEELEPERTAEGVSVGRLPKELRSTFEGERSKTDGADSRRKSNKSKGSRSQSSVESQSRSSRSSSNDSLSFVLQDRSVNGRVSPRERENLEGKSDRRDSSKEIQDQDISMESGTPEEKPVPKKLNRGVLTAFQKSEAEPGVQLRRVKSERRARPKSIGNVDLLRWQDDSNLRQSSSDMSKKEKTRRQPRPKSIAY